jgi:hypothetical protein
MDLGGLDFPAEFRENGNTENGNGNGAENGNGNGVENGNVNGEVVVKHKKQ